MSFTEAKLSRRRRRRARRPARGAALLEAVLVVSILVLSLVGTVYVARIYQTTLRALAVSRAAAIGHSNESCRGDDAASWFSREEAALLQAAASDDSGSQDSGAARVSDEAAQRAVSKATQSGSFGSPRVMSITTGGDVFGPLLEASQPGGIFYTAVKANDHVLCGEREHMRGSLGVLGFARDFFKF